MVRSKLLFAVAVVLGSLAMILGTVPAAQAADPPKCEPDKLATKYPGLVGKTIKVGHDAESPPYSFRDPKDFNTIIGADADMVRAAFKCIGVPIEFSWAAGRVCCRRDRGQTDVMWDKLYYTPERAKQVDYVIYSCRHRRPGQEGQPQEDHRHRRYLRPHGHGGARHGRGSGVPRPEREMRRGRQGGDQDRDLSDIPAGTRLIRTTAPISF